MLKLSRLIVFATMVLAIAYPAFSADESGGASQLLTAQTSLDMQDLSQMPLPFAQNQGQWKSGVLFRANAGGAAIWLTASGAYYQFTRPTSHDSSSGGSPEFGLDGSVNSFGRPGNFETLVIKSNLLGANPSPLSAGQGLLGYRCNFFLGNDPMKWQTNVSTYQAVQFDEVYPGINLKYYASGSQLEYDFIVSPGADYSQIQINYEGVSSFALNAAGELVIETQWGQATELAPTFYQLDNGNRIPISGSYRIIGDKIFGFEVGTEYNPALPLIIDPVLSYSTFLGGYGGDYGYDIAVNTSGEAFVTGLTWSSDFPVQDPLDSSFNGNEDIFVTKMSADGGSLLYSTYIGGLDVDDGYGIAIDGANNIYLTGRTRSTDFPTQSPYFAAFAGNEDAFVTKLSAAGNSLIFSTYIGGAGFDYGEDIDLDPTGNAYIVGTTTSTDFPIQNAISSTNGGGYDAFVSKFSSIGDNLLYSTYLGGDQTDLGNGIAVDAAGGAYVTGETFSANFPTANPFDPDHNGGGDAFVSKISPAGNTLDYSTFLGGIGEDAGNDIALNDSGNAYVTGWTNSSGFPTQNAYDATYNGGNDAFALKLYASGSSLYYSTFLGGSGFDYGYGVRIDWAGNAYIAGYTGSTNLPMRRAFDSTYNGTGDAFVTRFSPIGSNLVYSTYLGGSKEDRAYGVAIDPLISEYVTGYTFSGNFPTQNPYDPFFNSSYDVFVTKMYGYVCGDANGDGEINLLDVTFLINYVYKHSTAPIPIQTADVNSDGNINMLDMTYLIVYIYKHGYDPVCTN